MGSKVPVPTQGPSLSHETHPVGDFHYIERCAQIVVVGSQEVEHFIFAAEAMCMGDLGHVCIEPCMALLDALLVFALLKAYMGILAYCFKKAITPARIVAGF